MTGFFRVPFRIALLGLLSVGLTLGMAGCSDNGTSGGEDLGADQGPGPGDDLSTDTGGGEDLGADQGAAGDPVPYVTCDGPVPVGPKGAWRHIVASPLVTVLGHPLHRGIDLIATTATAVQHIKGEITYGVEDKALEDEAVEVFACLDTGWKLIGQALTDGEGLFDLPLSGAQRLPVGQRPLFLSVIGDRSGTDMIALLATPGGTLAVSDVDGTLTTSESAYPDSLVTGNPVAAWDGAPQALSALQKGRYRMVYLTSRGRRFTQDTRSWLKAHGFPVGPLHLAAALLTAPGQPTVDYKAGAMMDMTKEQLTIQVGIGNRQSDIQAYQQNQVPAQHIFVKRPEFDSEIKPLIDAGQAVGFTDYPSLTPTLAALPQAP